jgi:N6-L-threonylcarbamoyladenine synthase
MLVLAIETSCDETAVAVVDVHARRILAQHVYSQIAEHADYKGVIPELASRAHHARLPAMVTMCMRDVGLPFSALDAIAATVGPGLTTALAMGASFGKTLAMVLNKPFLAVNHIEGHALSPLLAPDAQALATAFLERRVPYLLMLLTGGHCQVVQVKSIGDYVLLGTTQDDAVGECFDKVGKMLGLPHPAGPAVEQLAASGQMDAVQLPHPRLAHPLDFSFSGLKTAVRDVVSKGTYAPADIAASFQFTVAGILAGTLDKALQMTPSSFVVVAGGVAANQAIRAALQAVCVAHGTHFVAPPLSLCTDNAAMIAYAGGLRRQAGLDTGDLGARVTPRWAL